VYISLEFSKIDNPKDREFLPSERGGGGMSCEHCGKIVLVVGIDVITFGL